MGLFSPKWMSKHVEKAIKAVEKVKEQETLKQIAENLDVKTNARMAAVARITDQKLLGQFAESDHWSGLRINAITRLTDQETIARIALTDRDCDACKSAIERIDDPEILARIALTGINFYARKSAVERISDQRILARVALTDDERRVRNSAAERISDPGAFASIALYDTDWDVRKSAIERTDDPEILARIALTDGSSAVRYSALTRFRTVAYDGVPAYAKKTVYQVAIDHITDREPLEKIVLQTGNSADLCCRVYALEKLDAAVCVQAALQSDDLRLRKAALDRLTDADAVDAALEKLLAKPFQPNWDGALDLLRQFTGRLPRSEKRLRAQLGAVHTDSPATHTDKATKHIDSSPRDGTNWNGVGSSDCHSDSATHVDESKAHKDSHPYRSKLNALPPYEGE